MLMRNKTERYRRQTMILEIGELLTGRLLIYDGLDMKFMGFKTKKDPQCGHCGEKSI